MYTVFDALLKINWGTMFFASINSSEPVLWLLQSFAEQNALFEDAAKLRMKSKNIGDTAPQTFCIEL